MIIRNCLLLLTIFLCSVSSWSQGCNLSTVYFKSGKYKLTKDSRQQIDSILSGFIFLEKYLVELHGLADTMQSAEFNHELVAKRIKTVRDYISSKGFEIYFIEKNSGEGIIEMQGNAASRRVDIWYTKISSINTVQITGEFGEHIVIPVQSFSKCGYCTTDMKLKSEWQTRTVGMNQTETFLSSSIETSCDSFLSRENCENLQWRIPASLYNSPDNLRMPVPLEFRSCRFPRDSISIEYLKDVKTEFDTLKLEYVVTVPCPLFGHGMCCGGYRVRDCPEYKFVFPEKLRAIENYMVRSKDSVFIEADSLYPYCRNEIVSYGFMNGKFVYLMDKQPDTVPAYRLKDGRKSKYFIATYKEEDYTSLTFSRVNVNIKGRMTVQIDSAGFFVPEYSAYIPFERLKKRSYLHTRLEKKLNQYAVYSEGKLYLFYSSELKSRYSKRKKVLKVIVRKRDLVDPSEIKEILVLPDSDQSKNPKGPE